MTNRILGGADILDAQLSADKSLLVIAERIGGVNKPNSTRFIMINTFNGEIVNYFTIESRLISKISFTNDRYVKLAAIQQKQEELDNPSPDAILIIDLEKRKISNEFVLPEKVTSIAYYKNNEDKEIIYYTLKDKSYFYIFDVELKTTEKEILSKIREEVDEIEEAMASGDNAAVEDELGDLLFAAVNLIRFRKGQDSEALLRQACRKFENRFRFIEKSLKAEGVALENAGIERMEMLWEAAKKGE
jgi:NTP pyrophosphatase (non-canonical NTP hydrolase)